MKRINVIILLALLVTSLACGLFSGNRGGSEEIVPSGGDDVTEESPPLSESGDDSSMNNAEFPLPSDVENFMDLGDSGINYQTSLSLDEVVDIYRKYCKGILSDSQIKRSADLILNMENEPDLQELYDICTFRHMV